MEKHSVFTFFKKYSFTLVLLLVFLAGCQGVATGPIDSDSTGWFGNYLVDPFSFLIKSFASFLNGNYGWSIILITLLIRLAIMPLFLKQTKSSLQLRGKMSILKPEMDLLKEKYKDKTDSESQTNKQQELMELYQKHNMNPLASFAGCLPMLIQFPILIGFYYAILGTPEIAAHSFLWFHLGQANILLTLIAVAVYFLQFKISQMGMNAQQKKQMALLGLISPLMIGIISFNAPAALPLYWTIGGIFLIFQTLISRKLYS
ncbi:OxaA precursor [Virgibacillus profundi]|uniref:Membrane protein insertase YidC n=1 Tax=Virgibacillus profundi TaxID=2024555 RepID=A0A2A2ICC3_9BACI|nr:membrane protein insertase YidC [Virgibacillus profundi]PAV29661.1 OxaA precursor [Virgibacillus profundi]PXY53833.1 OxaA precursor [Virgibacillus profundi]